MIGAVKLPLWYNVDDQVRGLNGSVPPALVKALVITSTFFSKSTWLFETLVFLASLSKTLIISPMEGKYHLPKPTLYGSCDAQ